MESITRADGNTAASQRKIIFKSAKKVIPVAAVKKDILTIQTLGDDMMNRTWDIESFVSRHTAKARKWGRPSKIEISLFT